MSYGEEWLEEMSIDAEIWYEEEHSYADKDT